MDEQYVYLEAGQPLRLNPGVSVRVSWARADNFEDGGMIYSSDSATKGYEYTFEYPVVMTIERYDLRYMR